MNTSCIRKPQVISGGGGVRTPCTLPLDPPLGMYHLTTILNCCTIICAEDVKILTFGASELECPVNESR